jgi:DNA invertase Pin-like site-specific DNA recombinase
VSLSSHRSVTTCFVEGQQGLDTTTPAGKAMFQMMGVFAEFERAMIRERLKAGLEPARAQGNTDSD